MGIKIYNFKSNFTFLKNRIMKFRILLCLLTIGCFAISSCGSDDDPNNGNVDCDNSFSITVEIEDELNAFLNAAQAYGISQTQENCNAYKAAGNDYVDALRALEDCARIVGELQEYNQLLDQLETDINNIPC